MFTSSKSSTMNKRLLPLRLYHFCVELAKKTDLKCIYDTVKKTNMYDNHTFILNGKKVIPTSIYNGLWYDSPESHTAPPLLFHLILHHYPHTSNTDTLFHTLHANRY